MNPKKDSSLDVISFSLKKKLKLIWLPLEGAVIMKGVLKESPGDDRCSRLEEISNEPQKLKESEQSKTLSSIKRVRDVAQLVEGVLELV
jgi:hypothetical protein